MNRPMRTDKAKAKLRRRRKMRRRMQDALRGLDLDDAVYLIKLDNYLFLALTNIKWPPWFLHAMKIVSRFGDGYIWVVLGLSFYLFNLDKSSYYFLRGVAGALMSVLLFVLIKNTVHRSRPYERHTKHGPLMKAPDKYSFPSGHTMVAFSMIFTAGTITWWILPFVILVALLIALSRMLVRVHYPLDVTGGALFGSIVGIAVSVLFDTTVLPLF